MTDKQLALYHRLPHVVQNWAASIHGAKLKRWRYGSDAEALAHAALSRDYWSADQWRAWQEKKLQKILEIAAHEVPFYRDWWKTRGLLNDGRSWGCLQNWPVLSKESLREAPERFIRSGADRARLYHEHTSGSTGKPLDLYSSRETIRQWYALFEARARLWHGVNRHDRWAILGGQLIAPVGRRKPPLWVWNASMRQLYMSSYHLAPDLIPFYVDTLERYQIRYLVGYSSALHALAEGALQAERKVTGLKVVITNAEPLLAYQREAISAAFHCPVRETYGMAETVCAASECEHGSLHMWPEAGITEIVDGELIATGLLNFDMPLIRYRAGDRLSAIHASNCPCGRLLPILESVEGRLDDVLYTTDGRRVGRLDPVLKSRLPVRELQIIQERLDHLRLLLVPTQDYTSAIGTIIADRLRARMGPLTIQIDLVDHIARGSNGKLRAVVCRLSDAERKRVANQMETATVQ